MSFFQSRLVSLSLGRVLDNGGSCLRGSDVQSKRLRFTGLQWRVRFGDFKRRGEILVEIAFSELPVVI